MNLPNFTKLLVTITERTKDVTTHIFVEKIHMVGDLIAEICELLVYLFKPLVVLSSKLGELFLILHHEVLEICVCCRCCRISHE